MSFENDPGSGYYDNDSLQNGDFSGGGFYPRPEPTPMGAPKRRRRMHWGAFFAVLIIVAAVTGGVYYLFHDVGVTLHKTPSGFSLSIGQTPETAKTAGESGQLPPAPNAGAQAGVSSQSAAQPASSDYIGTGATLNVVESPKGTETDPSDTAGALSLQEIYSKVIPSVVSISTTTANGGASGTGIVMSADGYIITNYHVVDGAQSVSVLTEDNQSYDAVIVGSDETSDLAVLKVEASGLTAAEFGDSDQLRVGDSVVAIGDPLGVQLRGTMTDGIISAINRDLTVNDRQMTLIQTNAALNNGNSGGPLINCYGQVIGINTMKLSNYYSSATVEGLGFAIPISTAKPIIDELIANGYVAGRPAIGITGESLPISVQTYYRLPSGVYVTSVTAGSDAAAKGITEGDIITAVDGTAISSIDDLNTIKNQHTAGDTLKLTVYRGGQYYDVEITLMDQAKQ
jgi:serine protease Do